MVIAIVACALGFFAFSVALVIALARAAALADREGERFVAERLAHAPRTTTPPLPAPPAASSQAFAPPAIRPPSIGAHRPRRGERASAGMLRSR